MIRKSLTRWRKRVRRAAARAGYHSKPSFLILGAQKAGTTALYAQLVQHPQVVPPRRKELHFFVDDGAIPYGDFAAYHARFPRPDQLFPGKTTFEATPSYLYHPECPPRIHAYRPDIRLIAVLRDPVARAYSAWNMFHRRLDSPDEERRSRADPRSFEEAVDAEIERFERNEPPRDRRAYLRRGIYVRQIRRYLKYFPRSSFVFLEHRELLEHPRAALEKTCRAIGVAPDFPFEVVKRNVSEYRAPIPKAAAKRLRDLYRPFNEELFALLDRRFAW